MDRENLIMVLCIMAILGGGNWFSALTAAGALGLIVWEKIYND